MPHVRSEKEKGQLVENKIGPSHPQPKSMPTPSTLNSHVQPLSLTTPERPLPFPTRRSPLHTRAPPCPLLPVLPPLPSLPLWRIWRILEDLVDLVEPAARRPPRDTLCPSRRRCWATRLDARGRHDAQRSGDIDLMVPWKVCGSDPQPLYLSYLRSMEDPSLTFFLRRSTVMATMVAESGIKGSNSGGSSGRIRCRSSPPFLCSPPAATSFSDGGGSSTSGCGSARSRACSPDGGGPDPGPVRLGMFFYLINRDGQQTATENRPFL